MPAKSKKKSAPIAPIDEVYIQAMSSFPVALKNTKAKGRHAAAADSLDSGVEVCVEDAMAFIVRSDYLDQQCHWCLSSMVRTNNASCKGCLKAYYCSTACQDQDATRHTLVCGALGQIDSIARATDVDPDLLRLMALILAKQQLKDDRGMSFQCLRDLVSHRERASPAFIRVIADASARLLSELPEAIRVPIDDMVTLACRINSNAHGLGDNEGRNTDVALGVFPLSAMFFNHACNPNCCFVGLENGRLAIRTIRPVQKDEELAVSYIDLYASRDERRLDLLNSKHFWCKCKRCQAPMARSVDRFLQSIVCEQCKKDVYVIPPSPMEALTAADDEDDKVNADTVVECASCGHAMAMAAVRSRLGAAQQRYVEGMRALRQQRDFRRARAQLEPLAKVSTAVPGELHPQASLRLNASIPLMNCLRHQDDIKAAIDINKFILRTLQEESITTNGSVNSTARAVVDPLPKNTAEISDFWQNLGELCNIMGDRYRDQGRKPLEKRYRKETRDAFLKAGDIRTIVFGPDHPKTKAVLRQAAEVAAGGL